MNVPPARLSIHKTTAVFLLAILSAGTCPAASPTPPGVPRLSQVNEHLYRGAQPSEAGLKSLAKLGIRAVIDLRGGAERASVEEKRVEALGMKYYSIPLPPLSAPAEKQISTILSLIEDSENWPVFVHCERGRDRTGTVVACYRIRHDRWPTERALTEARDHGLSRVEHGMREFILSFPPNAQSSQLTGPVR